MTPADEPAAPGAPSAPVPAATPAAPAAPEATPAAVPAAPAASVAAPAVAEPAVKVETSPPVKVEAAPKVEKVEVKEEPKPEPKAEEKKDELKPHTEVETLLEGAGEKKEEPKEAKPGEEKKPEEAKPGEQPPKIEFKPYHPPEGIKLDDKRITGLNEIVAKDMPPQERRDALLGMHVAEMQGYAEHLAREQHRVFAETRADWRKQAMADTEMGGSGWQTSLNTIAQMRDLFVPEAHREAFNNMLRITGAGDHPEFLRFLYNVGRKFQEPAPPSLPFQPPPDIGRAPKGNGRRAALYDNPTSTQNRHK